MVHLASYQWPESKQRVFFVDIEGRLEDIQIEEVELNSASDRHALTALSGGGAHILWAACAVLCQ